jgi:thiosulfate/3-mercaptopyruvate sulfurtransferase
LKLNYIILGACAGLIMLIALVHSVHASECTDLIGCNSGGDSWDPNQKLDEIGNPQADQPPAAATVKLPALARAKRWNITGNDFGEAAVGSQNSALETAQNTVPARNTDETAASKISEPSGRSEQSLSMLVPINDVSNKDILLDVSDNSTKHIEGSIVLPYTEFMLDENTGALKSVDDISKILGSAGISQNDSVVIYGECLPCGGGPSLATYVYWIMRSLGQKNVKVLDGNVEDWGRKDYPLPLRRRSFLQRPIRQISQRST